MEVCSARCEAQSFEGEECVHAGIYHNLFKTDFHILVSCEVNTVREVNLMFELVIHRAFSLLLLGPYCSLQYCWELYSIGENLRTG